MIVLNYGAKIYSQYFLFSNKCYIGQKKMTAALFYPVNHHLFLYCFFFKPNFLMAYFLI
jgi:hypothetical protein